VGESRRRLATVMLVLATVVSACGQNGGAFQDASEGRQAAAPVQVRDAPDDFSDGSPGNAGEPGATSAAGAPNAGAPNAGAPNAGATSAASESSSASGNANATGETSGSTTTAPPSSSGTASEPDAALAPAPPHQGLTSDAVKIAFIKLGSWQNLGANFGVVSIDWGDIDAQAKILVEWINANGGIDGRKVEYIVEEYKQEDASPDVEAQLCQRIADDFGAWAVVLQGQIHLSTRECYAKKGVLMLDPSPFSFDDDLYAQISPMYFSPSTPSITRVARALPGALHERGWFTPMVERSESETKLGIVRWDSPYALRVLEQDLTPALDALGEEIALVHAIDSSDAGTIQSGITNGIVRFRAEGINRVIFVGGNPIAPLWFLNAEQHNFTPRYGLTTFDGPAHTTQQTPNQMRDAMGIGFNPVHDVHDDQFAFPSPENPTEQFCINLLADGGQEFAARASAEIGLAYCESLLLLRAGAVGLGASLSAGNWATQVESLGTSFRAAVSFANRFAPGRHDGGRGYRLTEHRADCTCFNYVGDVRLFD
jgi:hypothetical protein